MGDVDCCALVIVTYNSRAHLDGCIRPWLEAGIDPQRVVVVDNASSDASAAVASDLGCTVVRNDDNRGFAAAANQGLAIAGTDLDRDAWIILLNPDTIAEAAELPDLVDRLQRLPDHIDGVLPSLLNELGHRRNVQPYPSPAAALRWTWDPEALTRPARPDTSLAKNYIVGSVLVLRARTWAALGGLDESYFLYGEDIDLSVRMHRFGTVLAPMDLPVAHLGNAALVTVPTVQQRLMLEGITLANLRRTGQAGARATTLFLAVGCTGRALAAMCRRRTRTSSRTYWRLGRFALRAASLPKSDLQKHSA